jgi:TolB-like protein/tetratricopeptide (TPR) repeat protein
MSLTTGTRLGTYEILGPLGAGGMGEVYRAKDLRLEREIAIKVLPAEVASNRDRIARFEREARTVAGLNHPNIVTLFSVEDEDGLRFLTMELVEGQTLSAIVSPGGLPLPKLLGLAIPLTEALVAAHEKGVIHRDLKPGNVMVTPEGRVKVLDFGLSKIEIGTGRAQITETIEAPATAAGQVLGTVPYMSPEQLRGEVVDARSDLFALGIILYELTTGRRPFTGATLADISSAILRDTPVPTGSVRDGLPPELDRIIDRCLEKNPRDRIQTARDVCDELRQASNHGEGGARIHASVLGPPQLAARLHAGPSVAVLPFVNRSGDAENGYFSDGLSEELLSVLTKIRGLRVAARASSFHERLKGATIDEVGRALNVATVLDGSVRKAGNRVRIGVQLVNASDGYHLWSDTYDRTLDDVFAVQDDIAQSVVVNLRRTLLDEGMGSPGSDDARAEVAVVVRGRRANPEAYDLYLRGRHLLTSSNDGPARAQEMFRRAVELAPTFAPAYAGLGEAYVLQSWLSSRDRGETVSKARGALSRAMALDDRLSEARVLSGQIRLYFDYDWSGAEEDFLQAIALDPGSDIAHRECANFLSLVGRYEEGLDEARKAQALDPLSVNATHEVGYELLTLGRLDEAAAEFRKAIDLNPTWIWGNIKLGMTHAMAGSHEMSMACVRRADELLDGQAGTPLAQAWLAGTELKAGFPERANVTVMRLEDESRNAYVDPFAIAHIHYFMGNHDAMFEQLERGLELRSPVMVVVLQAGRFLLREASADPRYRSVIERMKFPASVA